MRNIERVPQIKYKGSIKKSRCSFSCHFEIDKKINKDPKGKIDSISLLMNFSNKKSYVVHISLYTTRG